MGDPLPEGCRDPTPGVLDRRAGTPADSPLSPEEPGLDPNPPALPALELGLDDDTPLPTLELCPSGPGGWLVLIVLKWLWRVL